GAANHGAANRIRISSDIVGSDDIVGGALNSIRASLVQPGVLMDRVHLEGEGGCLEDQAREVSGVGVRLDQLGERVVLQLGVEVEAGGALQVIEAVAVLQLLELVFEHEVEGGAEQAAERHLLLGETADPQVDVAETGGGAAVEVRGVPTAEGPGPRAV